MTSRKRHRSISKLGWGLCALWMAGCGPLLGLDDQERVIDGAGGAPGCTSNADCDDDNPCTVDVCRPEGVCHRGVFGDGIAPEQQAGDCQRVTCDGGEPRSIADDTDVPPETDCDAPSCLAGEIVSHPHERGLACDDDGGRFCDGIGSCVECLADADCTAPETCGGAGIAHSCGCTPLSCFELGATCGLVSDTCFDVINCNDGVIDGDETDVDCGGKATTCFARCGQGQICRHGLDCLSSFCAGGSCSQPWSDGFGNGGQDQVAAVAVGPDGSIVISGRFSGDVDFGGGPLSGGSGAMFLVKLDADGAHVFSKVFPGGDPGDVAVDAAGNILLAGSFVGSIDFGIGALASALARAFVVKLDGLGNALWQRAIGGEAGATSAIRAVAVNAQNDVFVAGGFTGNLSIEQSQFAEAGNGDVFVVRLNAAGGTQFARAFGDAAPEVVADVAAAKDGSFAVAGHFAGSIDFGADAVSSKGGFDVFVARLDAAGAVVSSTSFGASGSQLASGVAFDGDDVVVTGSFSGEIGGLGVTLFSQGGFDVFAIKLREGLSVEWAEAFGSTQDDYALAATADPFGGVVISGGFQGSMTVGQPTLISLGGFDVFVVKLDVDGGVLFSRAYGGSQEDAVRDVDVSPFGTVVLAGEFRGSIDFGQGAIISQGTDDVFVAALSL